MTDNKQAPREVWCVVDGDRTDWGVWTGERRTDEQDRINPYGLPVVSVRYIRADVAAELARECLHTPWAPESTEYHSALMRIAELESEP